MGVAAAPLGSASEQVGFSWLFVILLFLGVTLGSTVWVASCSLIPLLAACSQLVAR